MFDAPEPDALLQAIAALLRNDIAPALQGSPAFHARVAANAIDLVRRQIATGTAADAREHARLSALLGRAGETAELTRDLAARLRAGADEADLPGLGAHLWATTLAKIAVDQPGYATIAHTRARGLTHERDAE